MNVCPCCGRPYWGPSCRLCTLPSTPAKLRAKDRKWRRKNRERVRARDKERRVRQSGKREAVIRAWQEANKEKMREYRRAYRARNLEKAREAVRRCNAAVRARKALEAAAQAGPPKPSPVADRLLKLAEARAKVEAGRPKYGITRIGYQEAR